MFEKERGQSLAELLVAVAVVTIIISSIVGATILVLRSNLQSTAARTAAGLGQEMVDSVRSIAESQWSNLYNVSPKGSSTTYRVAPSGTPPVLSILGGSEDVTVNNIAYTRFFAVENVNRDSAQNIVASGTEDLSTQKITVTIKWQMNGQWAEIRNSEYLTRSRNEVTKFTDWSGSSGVVGPVTSPDSNYFSQNGLSATSTAGELKLP